jgi:hypothetical protein
VRPQGESGLRATERVFAHGRKHEKKKKKKEAKNTSSLAPPPPPLLLPPRAYHVEEWDTETKKRCGENTGESLLAEEKGERR